MGIARKLEDVRQALDPMATQKDLAQFLSNAENAQKLNDLVDDIREAVMDYQVRTSERLALACLTSTQTSLQRDTYNSTRQLIVSLHPDYLLIRSNRQTG